MDGEESGSAFFQSSRCAYLCPRWKFQFWNKFALIGSLVILQGTQSCSIMMTQNNFLVVPHLLGSSFSVPFADRTSPHFFFCFFLQKGPPPHLLRVLSLLYSLDLGHFSHAQGLCILSIGQLFLSLYLQAQPLF